MPTIYTEGALEPVPCCDFRYNDFTLFSSPGPVEYLADGQWHVQQQPGLSHELTVVPIDGHVFLHWYMSVSSKPTETPGPDAGVMPAVGVYAKMNLGRFDKDVDVVAEGDTGTGYGQLPDPGAAQNTVTMYRTPSGDEVYEFRVPMHVQDPVIPSIRNRSVAADAHGYVVSVLPYQVETEHLRFTQAEWRLRTGPHFPNRLVMDVRQPLATEEASVAMQAEELRFEWAATAAFGSYDIRADSVRLTVDGPVGFEPRMVAQIRPVDHDGVFKPLTTSWTHDLDERPIPDGTYAINGSVLNFQGTYRLTWNETFEIRHGRLVDPDAVLLEGGQALPAPTAVAVLTVLALVFAGRHRRR